MPLRAWLAGLILLSAGLFAIGSAIERSEHHKESPAATETHSESGGGESAAHRAAEGGSESTTTNGHSESSEKIFGIDPESTGLVIAAVVAAVVLAAAVWIRPLAIVLAAVIAFGLVFAVFDVRELVHQVNESRAGLVVIAAILAAIHLGISAMAALMLRGTARAAT